MPQNSPSISIRFSKTSPDRSGEREHWVDGLLARKKGLGF